jgi:hypothetical protein
MSTAIRIRHAAEQAGITEEDMQTRLLGRIEMKVHEGDLVVPIADLQRLAKRGIIPRPTKGDQAATVASGMADPQLVRRVGAVAEAIGMPDKVIDRPVSAEQCAIDGRTDAVARSMGIDIAPAPPQSQSERKPQAEVQRAKARGRRRLGELRRWSQR